MSSVAGIRGRGGALRGSPTAIGKLFPPLGIIVSLLEGLLERFVGRKVEFPAASALELVEMRKALERKRVPLDDCYSVIVLHTYGIFTAAPFSIPMRPTSSSARTRPLQLGNAQ